MPDRKGTLYTGKGDEGYTSLLGPERIPKYDLRPEVYGTVDEATSFMGVVRADPAASTLTKDLILVVQRDLWIVMAELAAPAGAQLPARMTAERTAWLEAQVDRLGLEVPPLKDFVIPGDTTISAWLDVARTVVRRAERGAAQVWHEGYLENNEVLRYLNRLSSLLFILARYEEFMHHGRSTLVKDVA